MFIYNTVKTIATAFSLYFKSNFIFSEPFNDFHHDLQFRNVPCFRVPVITSEAVCTKLKNLKPNVSHGTDNISSIFLSKCADELSVLSCKLFNFSLLKGVIQML